MTPRNGSSRCRRLALLVALSSSAMQVLSLSLPSLVVCYRDDRPPQIEFFAAACSCRQEERHSGCDHQGSGAPCLESDCTDIHLGSSVAITAAAPRLNVPGGRTAMDRVRIIVPAGVAALRPGGDRRGIPGDTSPPPLSAALASSRLLC